MKMATQCYRSKFKNVRDDDIDRMMKKFLVRDEIEVENISLYGREI